MFPIEEWDYPAALSLRVAVVSSDMGLQWGDGQTGGNSVPVSQCDDMGDDGAFSTIPAEVTEIQVESGQIRCDEDGIQCPDGWACGDGFCMAPDDAASAAVGCEDLGVAKTSSPITVSALLLPAEWNLRTVQ